jgi:hypothetical protein
LEFKKGTGAKRRENSNLAPEIFYISGSKELLITILL